MTLSILYTRQGTILDTVESEVSLLLLATQNMIHIFKDNSEQALEAGRYITDHIRVLVMESRGTELMAMVYGDPFLRMINLLHEKKEEENISKNTSEVRTNQLIFLLININANYMTKSIFCCLLYLLIISTHS